MFKNPNERMPMWLAVGLSVVVGIFPGLWFGSYSFVLWLAFTVWAVYLNFGGTIKGGGRVMLAYIGGGASAALVQLFNIRLSQWMTFGPSFNNPVLPPNTHVVPVFIAYFIGFCVVVWWMKFRPQFLVDSLAYFSGISLTLGVIFTGLGMNSYIAHNTNAYVYVIGALILSIISAFGGCVIAFISVWLNGAKAPAEVPAKA
ncbi:MAG: hypothetical protein FWD74_10105 [Actinomycetia bacterium]|nr:hypothetical protein [Actinomycetes bacterium]